MERKLATVLAADVVGYSSQMERDEEGTLRTLRGHREAVDSLIAEHAGRIFNTAGDSVIAEFASPVEAVRCAIAMQQTMHERNADAPEGQRLTFRVGVNMGDVVVNGEDLLGGGVNVAARLESIAKPGGLCISSNVYDLVRDQPDIDFEDLGEFKVKNIVRPIRVYRVLLDSEVEALSPFRGLDVFDYEHARFFHGRARAIATIKERLEQQAASGKAFVLIYGLSGVGKSSLARAGVLPELTRFGGVAGIDLWRRSTMRPSDGSDPFAALERALKNESALPGLAATKKAGSDLAAMAREAPEEALPLIRDTLQDLAEAEREHQGLETPPRAALALVVDQLEELFTIDSVTGDERAAFVHTLAHWVQSGDVWVIATMRGDFYYRCGDIPRLSELKDGLGSYELLPPDGPEISQMIRNPAKIAGLRFEETPEEGRLEDVLQNAAMRDSASLPLLQFVLEALHSKGKGRVLTFADYHELGGLEGAIAKRAEEVFRSLPASVAAELSDVLRALVTVGEGEEVPTMRPVRRGELVTTADRRTLIKAFEGARLLVSSGDGTNVMVRLAHEALISHWPRARELIAAEKDLLRVRARVESAMHRWLQEDKSPDFLLPPGKPLAEAEHLITAWRGGLPAEAVEYVEASLAAQEAREAAEREAEAERQRLVVQAAQDREAAARKLARRTIVGLAVAMAFALVAVAFGWYALERESVAEARKAEVLRNQSRFLADQSQQQTAMGNATVGLLLALEALPDSLADPNRPYVPLAEAALYRAIASHREYRILRGHEDKVWHVAFSPDGRTLITTASDDTARLWDRETGEELQVLRGHQGNVLHAAFSPSGKRVVTVGSDATARLWNTENGKEIRVFRGHKEPIIHVAFDASGRRLLTASFDGVARIWNVETGDEMTALRGHTGRIAQTAFGPEGRRVVTASYDGTARLWDAATGAELAVLDGHEKMVLYADFSPDGRRLVTASADKTARVWDVASGEQLVRLEGHGGPVGRAVFSADGTRIATASSDDTARIWDAKTGASRAVLRGHAALVQDVDFSPDGTLVATASHDGTARLWDAESGREVAVLREHRGKVWHADFAPGGRFLATASLDGTVRIWDSRAGLLAAILEGHNDAVWYAEFDPDGRYVATASRDGTAAVWEADTGRPIATLRGHRDAVWHATFAPDGEHLVTASHDGTARLWETQTGRETAALRGHKGPVLHTGFSPDGQRVATVSHDTTARLWDAESGAAVAVLRGHEGAVGHLDWSPDGKKLVTAAGDHTARVWDANIGAALAVLEGHERPVLRAEFSDDGRRIATTSLDRTIRIWDAENGDELKIVREAAEGGVARAVFDASGRRVLAAGFDGTARMFDVETGDQLKAFRGHEDALLHTAFSPDGRRMVTASGDGTARLWGVETGALLDVLDGHADSVISASFARDGKRLVTASMDGTARIWRVLPDGQALIDYAKALSPRSLSPEERQGFFISPD